MRLEGSKVLLREFRREDLPLAVEYLNQPEVAVGQRIVIPFPYRIEDAEKCSTHLMPIAVLVQPDVEF